MGWFDNILVKGEDAYRIDLALHRHYNKSHPRYREILFQTKDLQCRPHYIEQYTLEYGKLKMTSNHKPLGRHPNFCRKPVWSIKVYAELMSFYNLDEFVLFFTNKFKLLDFRLLVDKKELEYV